MFQPKKLKCDIETVQSNISHNYSKMSVKAQKVKNLLDTGILLKSKQCQELLISSLHKQQINIKRHIAQLLNYEHMLEQCAKSPTSFLRFIKGTNLPQTEDTPHLAQRWLILLPQEINVEALVELLSEIKIVERGQRKLQDGKLLLSLMPTPVLQKSHTVSNLEGCLHLSCMTPDQVWVNDRNTLLLRDTRSGDTLKCINNLPDFSFINGIHTGTNNCDMIYIDRDSNVNKVSKYRKQISILIGKDTASLWRPWCVYCSLSTGDLFVGMVRTGEGKIVRYKTDIQITQTIQMDGNRKLYSFPCYVTENGNGDVVVSDTWNGVVVTDCKGRHRFTYTGPPSGAGLRPVGICTDAFSHILVCDANTNTIQMIDRDGNFQSSLLTGPQNSINPNSLSYETSTHTLWVGSWDNNTLFMYRYINRTPL